MQKTYFEGVEFVVIDKVDEYYIDALNKNNIQYKERDININKSFVSNMLIIKLGKHYMLMNVVIQKLMVFIVKHLCLSINSLIMTYINLITH